MTWLGVKELLKVHPQLKSEVKEVWLKRRSSYAKDNELDHEVDYVLGKLAGVYAEAFRIYLGKNRTKLEITDLTTENLVRRGRIVGFKIENTRLVWDDDAWAEVPSGINISGPAKIVDELRQEFLRFIEDQDLSRMRRKAIEVADGYGGTVVSYFYHPERNLKPVGV